MLDTLAVAQEMTAGGIDRDQAEAIANAMRKVAEQGDHVTADQFKAGQAEVRAEIADLRSEQRTQMAEIRTEVAEVRTEIANLDTRLSTKISQIDADLKSDMKLLKFGYGPVVVGLLVKLVFFP